MEDKMPKYAKIGITLAVAALAAFGGYMLFKTEPLPLAIAGFSWERKIDIEKLKTFVEEGSYVPSGGRELSQREDCGMEYDFSEGEFKYRCETIYTYEIDRWVYAYSVKTDNKNQSPYWPRINNLSELQRTGEKTQKYTVHLKNKAGVYYEYFCKEKEWMTYQTNETVLARLGRFGIRKLVKLEKE